MLHGDVKQRDREKIYEDFKTGRILKIVATNVAARGLDFPNIELVIQVEPPKQVEAYIHRAGRTGRAGNKGVSVVLSRRKDMERLSNIEKEGGFRFEELREKDLGKAY
jgi:ATP-dependent RNA helicase DDX21